MKRFALLVALLLAGCSSQPTPTGPTPPVAAPPSSWVLSGQVSPSRPMSGVLVDYAGIQVGTDIGGRFTIEHRQATDAPLVLTHPGILTRRLWLAGGKTRLDVGLEPIRLEPPFDTRLWAQLIRNDFDRPGTSSPLMVWDRPPKFYLRTTEDSGAAIDAETLTRVRDGLIEGVRHFSPFPEPFIESGPSDRPRTDGWITVRLHRRWQQGDPCGSAYVGALNSEISLYMDACRCPGERSRMAKLTVMHEVGHALGFWHVEGRTRLMSNPFGCQRFPTEEERFHAHLAYTRPRGNLAPDTDPPSAVMSLGQAQGVRVSCGVTPVG